MKPANSKNPFFQISRLPTPTPLPHYTKPRNPRYPTQTSPTPLRPLYHPSLCSYGCNNSPNICFNHTTTLDYLRQHLMEYLKIENEIQFTDILKHSIQGLDKDLNKV